MFPDRFSPDEKLQDVENSFWKCFQPANPKIFPTSLPLQSGPGSPHRYEGAFGRHAHGVVKLEHVERVHDGAGGDVVQRTHSWGNSGFMNKKKLLTRGTFVWSNYDNSTIIIWSSWSGDLVNGNRVDDEVWRNLSAFLFVKPTLVSLHLGRCHHHCEYDLWQKIQYHPDGKSARLIKMVEGPGGLACQCQTEEGGVGSVCGQVDFLSYHQKWRLEILK